MLSLSKWQEVGLGRRPPWPPVHRRGRGRATAESSPKPSQAGGEDMTPVDSDRPDRPSRRHPPATDQPRGRTSSTLWIAIPEPVDSSYCSAAPAAGPAAPTPPPLTSQSAAATASRPAARPSPPSSPTPSTLDYGVDLNAEGKVRRSAGLAVTPSVPGAPEPACHYEQLRRDVLAARTTTAGSGHDVRVCGNAVNLRASRARRKQLP